MTETSSSSQGDGQSFGGRMLAVAQLMRLANVFTAIADVWMGLIVAMWGLRPSLYALGVTACSALLYTAGMVLNDVFDAHVDARERPERPIPSGKISLRYAQLLGWNLLTAGVVVGILLSLLSRSPVPALIAWALAVTIVAYNAWLKPTVFGPLAMAACRAGNVLLGMSPAILHFGGLDFALLDTPVTPALGIGCYVFGITWFARYEHQQSRPRLLLLGATFVGLGIAILAGGAWLGLDDGPPLVERKLWLGMWAVVAISVLGRIGLAIRSPTPQLVQRAVKHAILSLILIDAVICLGYAGPGWACVVLSLLVPAVILSRWLRVT